MSRDIVVFDQLSDLKRLAANEAFLHIESVFQRERERYLAATLDPKADSLATMQNKAVVNALDQLSPLQLVERSLKIEVKNRKVENPELFKIKRKCAHKLQDTSNGWCTIAMATPPANDPLRRTRHRMLTVYPAGQNR